MEQDELQFASLQHPCECSEPISPPAGHGLVPKLLVPFSVGVAGSPAAIGVITGTAAPITSVTLPFDKFVTQTLPEPSMAMPAGLRK